MTYVQYYENLVNYSGRERPLLHVRLLVGQRSFETIALVDSGSPFTIFDEQIPLVLGINVDNLPLSPPLSGIGGTPRRYPVQRGAIEVIASAPDRTRTNRVIVGPFLADMVFYPGLRNGLAGATGILGTRDFFTAFPIGFNYQQGLLYLG